MQAHRTRKHRCTKGTLSTKQPARFHREGCFLKTSPASSEIAPLSKFTNRSIKSDIDANPHYCLEVMIVETSINDNEFGFTLPTPGANEGKGASAKRYKGSPHYKGAKTSEGLRTCYQDPMYLHPYFGEWMMNYPIGASSLKPLATVKTPL